MAYINLTKETFNETLDNNEIVIIDFWAEWCSPCKQFAPIFEKVAENNPDITFGKVNTEEQQALARQHNINSIPTLMVVRDGIILLNQGGMLPEAGMGDLIEHIKGLDMDKIRKEMAEDEED
ncbi:thioredoxin [Sulfurimonas sp.]|jgi:thioredoxin 1|uniref:thioredoxin n=1 Tax=Sulfurimonas sp. TaxID=2022749 RepID=UPI0025F55A66|nr:thioredoxin [Sulfurimonas sp.]MBT5934810.1 thioredoxin [Sulfurimonas sp.]